MLSIFSEGQNICDKDHRSPSLKSKQVCVAQVGLLKNHPPPLENSKNEGVKSGFDQ